MALDSTACPARKESSRAYRRVDRLAEAEQAETSAIRAARSPTTPTKTACSSFAAVFDPEQGEASTQGHRSRRTGPVPTREGDPAWPGGSRRRRRDDLRSKAGRRSGRCSIETALEEWTSTLRVARQRAEVVLHVDSEVLADHRSLHGQCCVESGQNVSAETSRRLSCDCSTVTMRHDPDGNTLDVGRRTRAISPALRRALDFRDSQNLPVPWL